MNRRPFIGSPLVFSLMFILWAFLTTSCDFGFSSESDSAQSGQQPANLKRAWPKIGSVSPPFALVDLGGNSVKISDFKGKVVLLNFWATWCGPCRVEMPAMEGLYQDLNPKGLEILAVSVDPQGVAATKPFKEALGLSFPILHDPDYQVGIAYGARTLPMTYLIDRQSVIRHRVFGARDWNGAEARDLISSLLDAA